MTLLDDAMSLGSEELWLLSLAAGSLAVVLVAVLFGLVIAVLQRVDRHAARTHTAAKQIAQNTVGLWALDQMNRDLVAIRDAARGAARAGTTSAVSSGASPRRARSSKKVLALPSRQPFPLRQVGCRSSRRAPVGAELAVVRGSNWLELLVGFVLVVLIVLAVLTENATS